MSRASILGLHLAAGIAAAIGCGSAHAEEPAPGPWPLAGDTPAYSAPAEPEDAAVPTVEELAAPLALRDALAMALIGNPELAAFSWETRASEARALQAGALRNPELDFRYTNFADVPLNPDESRRRLILSQVLEMGAKRGRRYRLAQTERSLAVWDYETKRVEVAADVTARFVAVVGAQQRVAALRRSVEFYGEVAASVAKLVELGSLGAVEIHRVNRALGLARIDLSSAESRLGAARARLATTWGSSKPVFTEAEGDLQPAAPLPDLERVLALAVDGPAIARWKAEAERGRAALALAKAERVPDLTYGAGVRWDDDIGDRDYLVDVELELPVFDRNKGGVREAHYDIAKAEANRRAAETATKAEVTEVYYALAEADGRARLLRDEVVPAARATMEALETAFQRQVADHDDLLDARRDLARAEIDLVDALVDYHQRLAHLESLTGHGLDDAGVPSE